MFCGSSAPEPFRASAIEVGRFLGERGVRLVYGGGSIGLMGLVAEACMQAGGHVTGVIPQFLVDREIAMGEVTELITTETMHGRKAIMADRADAFLVLPGGLGTLDEMFEIWTWSQLRLHAKPIGVLNVHGFFDRLLEHVDVACEAGFIHRGSMPQLHVAPTISEIWASWSDRGDVR